LNTDGSGYAVVNSFSDGRIPAGDLVLVGGALYGTTIAGGSSDRGIVFNVNTDGSGYAALKSFSGGDGAGPGGLVLAGSTLYGTTSSGGGLNCGAVFSLAMAPSLAAPLLTQTAEAGATVYLTARGAGYPPPTYHWYFDGTNIPSCTSSNLVMTNILSSESGTYSVVLSNSFGTLSSAPVAVNVIPAVERRPVPGVEVTGEDGSLVNVDYANALSAMPFWSALGSVNLSGTPQYYFDLTLPIPPQRFYRAWQTGAPSVIPSLDLHLVPAITLTGSIGRSVWVDCINRFGPIDAWVTLNTVTLTNTSQLYFDTSAWGQPQRLYRLVPSP
jgi:uncharacterized repeat protein (TIGR03803 family)